jgi:hypothetical protein
MKTTLLPTFIVKPRLGWSNGQKQPGPKFNVCDYDYDSSNPKREKKADKKMGLLRMIWFVINRIKKDK